MTLNICPECGRKKRKRKKTPLMVVHPRYRKMPKIAQFVLIICTHLKDLPVFRYLLRNVDYVDSFVDSRRCTAIENLDHYLR